MGLSRGWIKPNIIKIGICCFSSKYAALRSKSKDWLTTNYDDVYKGQANHYTTDAVDI
jgi:hypothetical protein